ncbi:aldo/keto reductase [Sphingosinicella sp. LHD-64]|uniref:aldo/keto reductase n=1 Tax=Sphingosinicella sp. LHD-64 TaxID=3072139 RepID=UPI00280D26E1|nr:aldo/keto reductase [Sphingosinicella sp. LHD-64]MDQ8756591.1 aldo/keto reductase [Sphingosinicella sp. LHD-64]
METWKLGKSGLATPSLVLGGNVFGYTLKGAEAFAVLDRFAAGGGTMVDTADVYSKWVPGHVGGESETVLGEWITRHGGAGKLAVATKVGWDAGLSAQQIETAVEGSLRRLGIEAIDLYYAHKDDPETPLEESLAAFDRLVKGGKVKALGASNYSAERLAEALAVSEREGFAPFTVLQPEYNLIARAGFEGALQALCVERGLGVLPYFGLASGFLTGKYRSEADFTKSPRGQGMARYLNDKGRTVLAALDDVAAETDVTPAQVALAWLAAQPGVTAPIASATSIAQLEELLGVMTLELDDSQVERLNAASA